MNTYINDTFEKVIKGTYAFQHSYTDYTLKRYIVVQKFQKVHIHSNATILPLP